MTAGRKIIGQSQHWGTPRKYVSAIKEFFGGFIDLDPCSNAFSIVGARVEYRLPEQDGLLETWEFPTIYVNPPYGIDKERGTKIRDWLERCEQAHRLQQSEVLALVPVATNTGHWKSFVFGKATSICFLYDTRLRFLVNGKDEGTGAPMSCGMIYWGKGPERFDSVFRPFGAVVNIESLKDLPFGQSQPDRRNKSLSFLLSK